MGACHGGAAFLAAACGPTPPSSLPATLGRQGCRRSQEWCSAIRVNNAVYGMVTWKVTESVYCR